MLHFLGNSREYYKLLISKSYRTLQIVIVFQLWNIKKFQVAKINNS